MRQILVLIAVAATALSQSVPIHACGDKLMMLGRGIRFQSKHTPRAAAVLLYLPESADRPGADGSKTRIGAARGGPCRTRGDVATAIWKAPCSGGAFDVVLANVTHAPELERAKASLRTRPSASRDLSGRSGSTAMSKQQSKADRDKALKDFAVIVEVPGRPGHYCHAVDEAMELKLKREKAAARRP